MHCGYLVRAAVINSIFLRIEWIHAYWKQKTIWSGIYLSHCTHWTPLGLILQPWTVWRQDRCLIIYRFLNEASYPFRSIRRWTRLCWAWINLCKYYVNEKNFKSRSNLYGLNELWKQAKFYIRYKISQPIIRQINWKPNDYKDSNITEKGL